MATAPEYRPDDAESEGASLRDYLGVLWRRKWVIVFVTVVVTAAAFGASYLQAKIYEAQTDLIYEQQLDVANPLTGQTYSDPTTRSVELQAVDAIIQSPTMTQRVDTILEEQGLPDHGVRGPLGDRRVVQPALRTRPAASSRSSPPARIRSWPRPRRRPTPTRSSTGARSA